MAETLARAGKKVVVIEQTETPDQLAVRNEERRRQGLKKVRAGLGGAKGQTELAAVCAHLGICFKARLGARETGACGFGCSMEDCSLAPLWGGNGCLARLGNQGRFPPL